MSIQPVHPQAQENLQTLGEYPIPVSESVEQTGPGTMVFLSYPKYYHNAEEKLALVETDLVKSTDPEWDYEVSKGIWQLKVKTDGTFQAQHEGDVFTYRFQNLGIGQGSQFRSVDLGEPDFSNFQIIGDTIRWSDVLPDIDLTVRYIHDILKVDVIVKKEFMNDLRAEVKSGGLSGDNYLTARFDIPSVFITSQAKQGDQARDIYAEAIALDNEPLTFERDGKVLHKLRPVESYVLDEKGEPKYWDASNEPIQIRSSQRWQLKRGGGGFAEMSANLGDLANAPEGDVVIDPSTEISTSKGNAVQDTLIRTGSSPRGSNSTETWLFGNTSIGFYDDRLLFGFNLGSSKVLNSVITSAVLEIHETSFSAESSNPKARAHKITTNWSESTATWTSPWSTSGGNFEANGFYSKPISLPNTNGAWMKFDVTQALRSHLYEGGASSPFHRGIMIKGDTSTKGIYFLAMDEFSTTSLRPILTINHQFTEFGVDPGNGYAEPGGNGSISERLTKVQQDNFSKVRFFANTNKAQDLTQVAAIKNKGMKAVMNFGIGPKRDHGQCSVQDCPTAWWYVDSGYSPDAAGFANFVEYRLDQIHASDSSALGNVVVGIEIGNEEAQTGWYPPTDPILPPGSGWVYYGSELGGKEYAKYYLEVYDEIKNKPYFSKIEIGASFSQDTSAAWGHEHSSNQGSHVAFARGFIDEVVGNSIGGYDKLPKIAPIHNYSFAGVEPPEFKEEDGGSWDWKEWIDRPVQIYNVFNQRKYFPAITQMEYGFSPVQGKNHAIPPSSNEIKHAVYYLRSALLTGTTQPESTPMGIGWLRHYYFHHPNDYLGNMDYGFYGYNPSADGVGNRRKISYLASDLHNPNSLLKFGIPEARIWLSARSIKPTTISPRGKAWCGWEYKDGENWQKWGAIWHYKWDFSYFEESLTGDTFVIPGNVINNFDNVKVYKYNFTSSTPNQLVYKTTIPSNYPDWVYDPINGQTIISIDDYIDEEPTFLEFTNSN